MKCITITRLVWMLRWKVNPRIRNCMAILYVAARWAPFSLDFFFGSFYCCRYALVDLPDMDVFGIANTKKAIDCVCPNCERPVASSRFAPHLEKCMGMLSLFCSIQSTFCVSPYLDVKYFFLCFRRHWSQFIAYRQPSYCECSRWQQLFWLGH